ncbi:MAG: lantibiotic immunity ABC transporter MutE/EpiE family permease subunit [Lachnospiraceae bacterium]|nr:lantibiotic immunity ABC transporter MutE/EpiE family permease subunit [Lachnospiraceae bacterium]
MRAYIKAELLKNRHSEWARLMVIFPTISILCSVYFSFGNAAYYQMNQYNWWYMCFLPIQVIAGSIFICRREKRLKYRAVQMLPVSEGKIWIAKVVSCIGQIIVSTGMIAAAVAGISLVLKQLFTGGNLFSPITVAAAWGLLVCAICWQIPLWMFCYQKTGMVLTFLLGMGANSILSTVWTTGSRWWMNPFAILPRLMCPVLQILPNGLPAVPESVMFTPQVLEKSVIVPGILLSMGLFALLTAMTARWYQRRMEVGWEK